MTGKIASRPSRLCFRVMVLLVVGVVGGVAAREEDKCGDGGGCEGEDLFTVIADMWRISVRLH